MKSQNPAHHRISASRQMNRELLAYFRGHLDASGGNPYDNSTDATKGEFAAYDQGFKAGINSKNRLSEIENGN